MAQNEIGLENVQETLLMPLWGRAYETCKEKPFLVDRKAYDIVKAIKYDFSKFEENVHPLSRAAWIARSIYFDSRIKEFIQQNDNAEIINIGCGLDTTYDRIGDNTAKWYEIDFPNVIELRKKYIGEKDNRTFISSNALSFDWVMQIEKKENVMFLLGGVIYYFSEEEVKGFFSLIKKNFKKAMMICDYSSSKGNEIANKKVIENNGMDKDVIMKWGVDDIYEIEKWDSEIEVLENRNMFSDYKKNYPIWNRIGFNLSDKMKIMSLAKIQICGA